MTGALAPIADKVGKLLRTMLSTDKDGEVVAAAQALRRVVQSAGMDLHTFTRAIEKPDGAISEADLKHIYDTGFADGLRKAEQAQHADNDDFRDIDDDHREVAQRLLNSSAPLTAKQREFLRDMTHWRGRPTARQREWLAGLARKFNGRAA